MRYKRDDTKYLFGVEAVSEVQINEAIETMSIEHLRRKQTERAAHSLVAWGVLAGLLIILAGGLVGYRFLKANT